MGNLHCVAKLWLFISLDYLPCHKCLNGSLSSVSLHTLVVLDTIPPRNYNAVNVRTCLHQKSISNYIAGRGWRFNKDPFVTGQEEGRLSDYLRIRVNLYSSSAFWALNVGFSVAVQAQPEWHDLYFFVKLHDIGVVWGVCIRVRWQVVQLFLLGDVIDANFMWWPFLAQHDLLGEGYSKFDGRWVDLAEGLSYWIVVFSRHSIIHVKH